MSEDVFCAHHEVHMNANINLDSWGLSFVHDNNENCESGVGNDKGEGRCDNNSQFCNEKIIL